MENKKFGMLNTSKKNITTHAEIQDKAMIKRGGRPKKDDKDKLNSVVSLNVNQHEKETLESEAISMGLNVVSLIRMSISYALKEDFNTISIVAIDKQHKKNSGKVVKQYAISVTKDIKEQLEDRANRDMMSISELLKISLKISGHYNI
ncbi:MAG: hypothetical protein FNT15_09700 [Sulfurovum sp.]|jgi:hypothetical protein|nr:MAG: hypothetical protein FNT15_09700 [Sulfurovum sp.]